MLIFEDERTYQNVDAFWEVTRNLDGEHQEEINQQLVAQVYGWA